VPHLIGGHGVSHLAVEDLTQQAVTEESHQQEGYRGQEGYKEQEGYPAKVGDYQVVALKAQEDYQVVALKAQEDYQVQYSVGVRGCLR